MKTSDLREMSIVGLHKELDALLHEQFNMRIQKASGQPVCSHRINLARKDVARIKTILREQELKGN